MSKARVRQLVRDRANGCCELCGILLWAPFDEWLTAHSFHHRQPRGMGGTKTPDTPANLLLLCGSGTTGCHGRIESDRSVAEENGWIVRHPTDPAKVPVLVGPLEWKSRVFLTVDGEYELAA